MVLPVIDDAIECQCELCVSACRYKPGWFAPGEAEKAAALLGLSLKSFFSQHLMADYWVDDVDIFVLSPAIVGGQPGSVFPFDPLGQCVFFGPDNRCRIHAAKPFECRATDHRDSLAPKSIHAAVADSWRDNQQQVLRLLGRS